MDAHSILIQEEVTTVLKELNRKKKRSVNSWQNLIVFRLSCCCGLRCTEICGANVGDVDLRPPYPSLLVRKEVAKGKKRKRRVPLWWDKGTRDDLEAWVEFRRSQGAADTDPLVCAQSSAVRGGRLSENKIASRWKTAIKCLDRHPSIHKGRHSYCTHALDKGRSLAQVRDAAGHANVSVTNIYLHALDALDGIDLFPQEDEDEE